MANNFFVTLDTILSATRGRNALGVTSEGDNVGTTEVGGGINGLAGRFDNHVVVFRIVEPLDEGRAFHRNRRYGAGQTMLFENRPMLGFYQLNAFATKLVGRRTHFLSTPVLGEAPRHNGLIDATLLYPHRFGFTFLDVSRSSANCTHRSETSRQDACSSL